MNDDLDAKELRKIKFHPENNENVISLVKRPDGNWRGFMYKNEVLHQTRQATPDACLQYLLTAK